MSSHAPQQFWMVYGIGQGSPTRCHSRRDLAEAEAKRLARASPGTTFVVLEAVTAITKREFDVITLRSADRADDDGRPF